jgi:hypothetical protein
MECFHFLLRFAQDGRRIKTLGNSLAPNLTRQPKVGAVAGIVASSAVTSRFPALTGRSGDGASTEIAESGKPVE